MSVEPSVKSRAKGHRDEGLAKVTGQLRYVDDIRKEQFGDSFLIAMPVTARHAPAKVVHIDDTATLAVPGVRWVVTHANAPKLSTVTSISMAEIGELVPLQTDKVHYYGECVAIVIADDLLSAQEGVRLLSVSYQDAQKGVFTLNEGEKRLKFVKRAGIASGRVSKGNAIEAFEGSPVKVDHRYTCAPHHHNPIEIGSVIARWDDDGGVSLTMATQWHHAEALAIGQAFRLDQTNRLPGILARVLFGRDKQGKVRITNLPSGGAFGRNLNTIHMLLSCVAAKVAKCAVKLVLTREDTFSLMHYRGEVDQRLRFGASEHGKIATIISEPDVAKGFAGQFIEPVGETILQIYDHDTHLVRHRVAALDMGAPGFTRGPGISSAMFALESAMDELAHQVGQDPLDCRLANYAEINPENGKPWMSKSLRECYQRGADAFGWRERPSGGALRSDGRISGFGMATSFDKGRQFPGGATVELKADGSAVISLAVAEIGQGIWTALRTLAAESLGIDRDLIELRTNKPDIPYAAGSLASTGTFSNASAVHKASSEIKAKLFRRLVKVRQSPFFSVDPSKLGIFDGVVKLSGDGPADNRSCTLPDAFGYIGATVMTRKARTGRTFGMSKSAKGSFGAIFTEIALDPLTMAISVERMVGAFACGRIVEPRLAKSQLEGGMIWGIGQALCEETRIDARTGKWVNSNLAEALVPVQADIGALEIIFVEEDNFAEHPIGMKGLAEIAVIGPAPAIANAIFDATGNRIRSLPLSIEHRLGSPYSASSSVPKADVASRSTVPAAEPGSSFLL